MVLVVSVVYRGCAIPVAWTVLPATEKHAWRGEWLRMLRQVRAVVPRRFFVIVLSRSGVVCALVLSAHRALGLASAVTDQYRAGRFGQRQSAHYQPLRELVPQPGTQWVGTGTAFQGPRRRLNCTLLARWDEGYRDPWLLLTDLAPSAGEACWYGLRAWIEQGFKITKRGGWQWQRTRMSDPQRAARLWLAVAVATLWLLSVGGMAEDTLPVSTLLPLADADGPAVPATAGDPITLGECLSPGLDHHPGGACSISIASRRAASSRSRGRRLSQDNTLRGTPELLLGCLKSLPLKEGQSPRRGKPESGAAVGHSSKALLQMLSGRDQLSQRKQAVPSARWASEREPGLARSGPGRRAVPPVLAPSGTPLARR